MRKVELYKLIQLKQKYGQIYVYESRRGDEIVVQRQPTLREIKQQLDLQKAFNLTTSEMFVELAKQLVVIPDNVEDASREQIYYIAERLLDNVPTSEKELEEMAAKQLDNSNSSLHDIMAIELWSQIQGTTIDHFYDVPINDLMQMYQYIRSLEEMQQMMQNMQQQQQQQQYQKQTRPSLQELEQILTGEKQPEPQNAIKVEPKINDNVKQFFGKNIDEVFEMLTKNNNRGVENG